MKGAMRGKRILLPAALLVAVAVVAIALSMQGSQGKPEPFRVLYGVDTCAECGMLVTARPSVAQMTTAREKARFCDVGCLLLYVKRAYPGLEQDGVLAMYVPDWETLEWVEAEQAWWVTTNLATPMGWGVVTTRDRTLAEGLAREHGGRVMDFQEALALDLFWEGMHR